VKSGLMESVMLLLSNSVSAQTPLIVTQVLRHAVSLEDRLGWSSFFLSEEQDGYSFMGVLIMHVVQLYMI
jgi:hypothetical protein